MAETLVASKTLVDVRDLKMHFPLTQGILVPTRHRVCARC